MSRKQRGKRSVGSIQIGTRVWITLVIYRQFVNVGAPEERFIGLLLSVRLRSGASFKQAQFRIRKPSFKRTLP